jgi:hypothetical protein
MLNKITVKKKDIKPIGIPKDLLSDAHFRQKPQSKII